MPILTHHRNNLVAALALLLMSLITPSEAASGALTVVKIDASGWHELHKPEHTIDRDAETTWSADGYGQFVQYELSEEIGLTELEVDLRHSASRSYQLRVQTSTDGQKWETVLLADTTLGIDGFERLEPKPSQARYVRIVGLGNSENEWINIQRLRLNGRELDRARTQLPQWNAPNDVETIPFGPVQPVAIWGADGRRPVYFDEWLPTLFERTLVLDEFELGGGELRWIFTSSRGGLSLHINENRIEIVERFYDTPAYLQMESFEARSTGHPEQITRTEAVYYSGDLKSVTVRMDHKLGLTVLANGHSIAHSVNLLNYNRHQLNVSGADPQVSGKVLLPGRQAVTVSVDPETKHQTIIGFGGIASMPAYHELSERGKREWFRLLREYNLLVHRENPVGMMLNEEMDNWDQLSDARPHYYADNFPNGEVSDFEYLKEVRKIGGRIVFEFWELPPWCSDGKRFINAPGVERYAEAMIRYCELVAEHTGAPPEIVGVQNEISQPTEMFHAMTVALRKRLGERGYDSVKIHMADAPFLREGIERVRGLRTSSEAWDATDYSAVHMYDYQVHFTDPDAYDSRLAEWSQLVEGKPLLSHEISFHRKRWQSPDYRIALSVGQLYHKNMVLADAAILGHCWTLLSVEQPSYGWTRSLFVPDRENGFVPKASSHLLRVFGSFSRRIHEGMQRIDAQSDHEHLLVSAYMDDGRATLVAINRDTKPLVVSIDWPGVQFTAMELTDANHSNEVRPVPDFDGDYRLLIEPGAIVTVSNVELIDYPAMENPSARF